MSSPSGLTVDNLCGAIRHFLQEIVAHPEIPVDQVKGLELWGVPADETMHEIMELFGGTLKITVHSTPVVTREGANVCQPAMSPLELTELDAPTESELTDPRAEGTIP